MASVAQKVLASGGLWVSTPENCTEHKQNHYHSHYESPFERVNLDPGLLEKAIAWLLRLLQVIRQSITLHLSSLNKYFHRNTLVVEVGVAAFVLAGLLLVVFLIGARWRLARQDRIRLPDSAAGDEAKRQEALDRSPATLAAAASTEKEARRQESEFWDDLIP